MLLKKQIKIVSILKNQNLFQTNRNLFIVFIHYYHTVILNTPAT